MDLEIGGRNAIVCSSSKGFGFACAEALVAEGANVVINGRDADRLQVVAAQLRQRTASWVTPVVADITTAAGRAAVLAACPEPDILINNNMGPEPGDFFSLEEEDWISALRANMISPLLLSRAVVPGMRQRKFGRIINITSAMVTACRPYMALSVATRGGSTVGAKEQSLVFVGDNVTINNLLPERIDANRHAAMLHENISYEEEDARARQIELLAVRRMGNARELGATCAFLCSELAGFISGQNIYLDCGTSPGVF